MVCWFCLISFFFLFFFFAVVGHCSFLAYFSPLLAILVQTIMTINAFLVLDCFLEDVEFRLSMTSAYSEQGLG